MSGLEVGRINVAARAVGVAQAAFEDAIKYAQQRQTFGQPIARHQAIQLKLADMATRIEAARLLVEQAARKKDQGELATWRPVWPNFSPPKPASTYSGGHARLWWFWLHQRV